MLVKKMSPIHLFQISHPKDEERDLFSKVHMKYRKVLECCKDIENDFCLNNFLNNNLDTEFESLF